MNVSQCWGFDLRGRSQKCIAQSMPFSNSILLFAFRHLYNAQGLHGKVFKVSFLPNRVRALLHHSGKRRFQGHTRHVMYTLRSICIYLLSESRCAVYTFLQTFFSLSYNSSVNLFDVVSLRPSMMWNNLRAITPIQCNAEVEKESGQVRRGAVIAIR